MKPSLGSPGVPLASVCLLVVPWWFSGRRWSWSSRPSRCSITVCLRIHTDIFQDEVQQSQNSAQLCTESSRDCCLRLTRRTVQDARNLPRTCGWVNAARVLISNLIRLSPWLKSGASELSGSPPKVFSEATSSRRFMHCSRLRGIPFATGL